jgi:oligopeptide/dipeptide ABC transporter ATP-binding protein
VTPASALLELDGLSVELQTERGPARALDGVRFALARGETLALVGESGCGKSLTALAILRLLPGAGRVVAGAIRFDGQDVLTLAPEPLRALRGRRIGMVFQEPMSALNPVMKVGEQVAEAVRAHLPKTRAEAWARAVEGLRQVGIPSPEERAHQYPHQLSGGMRQRVVIAMALACDPDLLIADEPTTALDVTLQAQILELLRTLQRERQMAMLFISHDLGLVAQYADRIAVMYGGRVVETATPAELFAHPQHWYTRGLLRCAPALQPRRTHVAGTPRERLPVLQGTVPAPWSWPEGCRFRDRCERADEACKSTPPLQAVGERHDVACHHPAGGAT